MDINITRQITINAFISPPGSFITLYNHSLKLLTGLILLKKPDPAPDLNASPCLKMSIKKGLSKPNDNTPKMADNILNPK